MSAHPFQAIPCTIGDTYGTEEEGFCENCGTFQEVGRRAFYILDTQHETITDFAFCSRQCCAEGIRKRVEQLAEA